MAPSLRQFVQSGRGRTTGRFFFAQGGGRRPSRRRRGAVAVMALFIILVLTTMAVALCSGSVLELRKSSNGTEVIHARLAAESGLDYMKHAMLNMRLPYNTTSATLMAQLRLALGKQLDRTSTIGQGTVTLTGDTVAVPSARLQQGTFTSQISLVSGANPPACRLTVVGWCGQVSRSLSMRVDASPRPADVFNYGIASRGKIYVTGSATVEGVNSPAEASILSMRAEPVAIEAGGSATITGDLFVTGANSDYVLLRGGGLTVGGCSDVDQILRDHVFLDVNAADFPALDNSQITPYATNLVDSSTDFSHGGTFTNIRVKAGTNPTFGQDAIINGVIYIEAPNTVTFGAKATINGIIVTADGGNFPQSSCQIDFKGQASAPGVSALPNTQEWANLKRQTGTIILAPGFELNFRGTTNSINGTVAADKINFGGTSAVEGRVNGSILGLKDNLMTLKGNTTIRLSRSTSSTPPAGFRHPIGLFPSPSTYSEN